MTLRFPTHSQRGFTLVELSIVLVIVGFILAGILNAQSVMRNARTKDTIKAVNDIFTASQQFRDRYGAWPGTLQNAPALIPNLTATCTGNTTGIIANAAQSACASESLIRSNMLRGDATSPITIGANVIVSIRAATAAQTGVAGIPAGWRNAIRVQNIDCDIAVQIDRAMDDGSTNTGNFITTAGLCGAGGNNQSESITVANAALRLN